MTCSSRSHRTADEHGAATTSATAKLAVSAEIKVTLSSASKTNDHGKVTLAPRFRTNVDVKVTLPGTFKTNDRGKVTLKLQPR